MIGRCDWLEDDDGNWETSCGECFYFEAGSPHDNKCMFCGFCGGRLIEHKYSEKEEVEP
jgi:rRNA maturation endonuclease Nob1